MQATSGFPNQKALRSFLRPLCFYWIWPLGVQIVNNGSRWDGRGGRTLNKTIGSNSATFWTFSVSLLPAVEFFVGLKLSTETPLKNNKVAMVCLYFLSCVSVPLGICSVLSLMQGLLLTHVFYLQLLLAHAIDSSLHFVRFYRRSFDSVRFYSDRLVTVSVPLHSDYWKREST